MAPAPVTAVLAGMALGGMVMTTTRAVVILLAGVLLFGVAFQPTSWLALAAVTARDAAGPVRPRHGVLVGLSALGPRGVARRQPLPGAGLPLFRPQLSGADAG